MNEPIDNKHTMKNSLLFVGLDVHAQNITIALASAGEGETRLYGTITHDLHALEKVFAKLGKAHLEAELLVCYEAGPRSAARTATRPSNAPGMNWANAKRRLSRAWMPRSSSRNKLQVRVDTNFRRRPQRRSAISN